MKIEYLESEGFFTSNGLFKIRNKFSRKKFPYFPQFLAKSSCQRYLYRTKSKHTCRSRMNKDDKVRGGVDDKILIIILNCNLLRLFAPQTKN